MSEVPGFVYGADLLVEYDRDAVQSRRAST
jgi:hypothetical protein